MVFLKLYYHRMIKFFEVRKTFGELIKSSRLNLGPVNKSNFFKVRKDSLIDKNQTA